jgi:hypothetical protein
LDLLDSPRRVIVSDVSELLSRIDRAIGGTQDKVRREQQELLQDNLERQRRLGRYEEVRSKVREIAAPRLKALAERAGERVLGVTPRVTQTTSAVTFDFKAREGFIKLTFTAAPGPDVRDVVVDYDLEIIPVLEKFDSHYEFRSPIEAFDAAGLEKWLDDRIVGFVELYLRLQEKMLAFDRAEYVEDPVANVKFPKFAAGATLEHGGQTYHFVDERTKEEFARQKGLGVP